MRAALALGIVAWLAHSVGLDRILHELEHANLPLLLAATALLALFGVPASQSFALSALFAVEGLLIHSTAGATAFLLGGRREGRSRAFRDPASLSLDGPDSVR